MPPPGGSLETPYHDHLKPPPPPPLTYLIPHLRRAGGNHSQVQLSPHLHRLKYLQNYILILVISIKVLPRDSVRPQGPCSFNIRTTSTVPKQSCYTPIDTGKGRLGTVLLVLSSVDVGMLLQTWLHELSLKQKVPPPPSPGLQGPPRRSVGQCCAHFIGVY